MGNTDTTINKFTTYTSNGEVEQKASYRLLEESILPVWLNQRPISALGFVYLWIGIAVIIAIVNALFNAA